MFMLNFLISILSILVTVAFYTIMERKMLSYIQMRMGPNKVGIMGILQPFSDALKLFNKSLILTEMMNFILCISAPFITFFLTLIIISILPFYKISNLDNNFSMITFMMISSFNVYAILMIGWGSNSKYAHIGAYRSMAQMISYEVSFFIIILFITILSNSYYFTQISETQSYFYFFWGHSLLFFFWLISCLAEVNRSPFDFAEGESELVSGFNVEFMGGWFALIFLAEYSNMIILSFISTILFFKNMTNFIPMILITLIMLWVRASLPRFRFDLLMLFSWKMILPFSLFYLPMSFFIYSISMSI